MSAPIPCPSASAPIGVFDSGIGGLSVLRALRAALPHEHFVYLADSAAAPYGERDSAFVAARSQAAAEHLRSAYGAKLLVIACNTASAAAAQPIRAAHPGWPVVAIEPALKPAARRTRTGHVGVWATRGTVHSPRFAALAASLQGEFPEVQFRPIACDGLASGIEQLAVHPAAQADAVDALIARHLAPLGPLGRAVGEADTLVLGCTHYPLVAERIARQLPAGVALIEPGEPVARQAWRLLHATGLLRPATDETPTGCGGMTLLATGSTEALQSASVRWLGAGAAVRQEALAAT